MYVFVLLNQSGNMYLIGFNSSIKNFFNNYIKNMTGEVLEQTDDLLIVKTDAGALSSSITIKGIFLDNISNLYISIQMKEILQLMKIRK